MTDLVETVLEAAAEAIRNQRPAIVSDAGRLKSITLGMELSSGCDVVELETRCEHNIAGLD